MSLLLIPLVAVGIALAFTSGMLGTGPAPALGTGAVAAEHSVHEFGTQKIHGGLLTAQFPLTVDGEVSATDLTTS